MVNELKDLSWLNSLSTAVIVIIAITVIVFALAKFGVFNKILDNGKSEKNHKEVLDNINVLLANDEHVKSEIDLLQREQDKQAKTDMQIELTLEKVSDRVDSMEASFKDLQMESYKKTIFDINIPLIDKMAAAIKFLKEGGNSDTSKYVLNELAYMDRLTWNALCKALGAMQYWKYTDKTQEGSKL